MTACDCATPCDSDLQVFSNIGVYIEKFMENHSRRQSQSRTRVRSEE
jgi:hypothetical protein